MAAMVGCGEPSMEHHHQQQQHNQHQQPVSIIDIHHKPIKIKLERPEHSDKYQIVSPEHQMDNHGHNQSQLPDFLNQAKPEVKYEPTEEIVNTLSQLPPADCLWNHYSELYKNKDCRAKAIESICASLEITKHDYGKKVHNLRNQFNAELKKLERRLEESGGDRDSEKACRWEHFKTLMFLRSVIEPRPGYQQGAPGKVGSLNRNL